MIKWCYKRGLQPSTIRKRTKILSMFSTWSKKNGYGEVVISKPRTFRPNGKQIRELIDQGKLKELHIHNIDRLGRNTLMVLSVWKELTELGVRVICRNPNIQNMDEEGNTDPFSNLLLEILVSMSSFEKSMIDMRRTEGIERTKKLEPWKYSGRKIGSVVKPEDFLKRYKSVKIMKDLDNGYTIREIMEMRKCSPGLVSKVKKLRKEVHET